MELTEKEKQLLTREICTRFPYGVICTDLRHGDSKITEVNIEDGLVYCPDFDEYVKIENCRLYLRPMSSMTDEEQRILDSMCNCVEMVSRLSGLKMFDKAFDWLNTNHFNYCLPPHLFIEAPADMYK
jgi:hypothetical protein